MDFTIHAVNGYVDKIRKSGFDGVLINITNPCDIVTRQLALGLDLPRGRVFGTGTGLDTSRLLSALSMHTGVDHKSITAYMMGEHGAQQFAPWSCVSFAGMPLEELAKRDERFRFDHDEMRKTAIGGGWVTFKGKNCTEYGIATTAARMASVVLHARAPHNARQHGTKRRIRRNRPVRGRTLPDRQKWRGAGNRTPADRRRARYIPRMLRRHTPQHGAFEGYCVIVVSGFIPRFSYVNRRAGSADRLSDFITRSSAPAV